MSNVLDGMTREQALDGIYSLPHDGDGALVVINGKPHIGICPSEIGIEAHEMCGERKFTCCECMKINVNQHFDALEAAARPRWVDVMPSFVETVHPTVYHAEDFYGNLDSIDAEIVRTNADRKVRAFIASNGGSGDYCIRLDYNRFSAEWSSTFCLALPAVNGVLQKFPYGFVGIICCKTEELANEVIRRFPAELSLLCGVEARA